MFPQSLARGSCHIDFESDKPFLLKGLNFAQAKTKKEKEARPLCFSLSKTFDIIVHKTKKFSRVQNV